MTASLRSSRIALLTAGSAGRAELRHCWYAVLARAGKPVRLTAGDVAVGLPRPRENDEIPAAAVVADVAPSDYAGLVVVGGSDMSGAGTADPALTFIAESCDLGVPVAACGFGVMYLALADRVRGRRLTGPAQLRARLSAAGAVWVDEPVVRCGDGQNVLITGRPGNRALPAFCDVFTKAFAAHCRADRAAALQQG
jgi:protease I